MFAETNNNNTNTEEHRGEGHESRREEPSFDPFGWGNFFGGQAFAHRGPPPPADREEDLNEKEGKDREQSDETMRDEKEKDNGEGPSCNSGSDNEGRAGGCGRRHGRCGGRREGRCGRGGPGGWGGPWGWGGRHGGPPHHRGPWGGPHGGEDHGPGFHRHGGPGHHHGGPGHHHGGPRGFGRRGGWGWGGRGGGHPFAAAFDPSTLVANFWEQFQDKPTTDNETTTDHTPDADIFDTETAYVIHVSLPGAKKEDVGVNWDAEKSELSIAGVIYRPGDEEFLKTLAMNERKVGPFERKVRLGTRATPAHVDIDGITAKLEDGILRVEVPKLDAGYVEVRKVDIE